MARHFVFLCKFIRNVRWISFSLLSVQCVDVEQLEYDLGVAADSAVLTPDLPLLGS